jgi:gliding motility-associated lipoprotein GldD
MMRNPLTLISLTTSALAIIFTMVSCDEPIAPKPRGYFRIHLPEHHYTNYSPPGCPFEFEVPDYALVSEDSSFNAEPCWLNVDFPAFKGTVYLSYKQIHNDLPRLLEDCRSMAMKHTAKASAIDELEYTDSESKIYGLTYLLKGNSASPVQFWITDSTSHFLRGSLYFYAVPNPDSIAPVLTFVKEDIRHLMETVRWK